MICPSCSTTDVKRAAMTWEGGTQISVRNTGKQNVKRIGAPVQTLSAFKLAPPERPGRGWGTAFLIFVGLIVLAAALNKAVPFASGVLRIAAILLPIYFLFSHGKKTKLAYERAMAHWNQLWHCSRCGHTDDEIAFRPAPSDSAIAIDNHQQTIGNG